MICPKCYKEIADAAVKCPFCETETKKGNGKEIQKVFISSEDTANFCCPQCNRTRTMDVSKYKKIKKAVRLKYKCKCGHSCSVILERRKGGRRKETELFGGYMCIRAGESVHTGQVVVKDVSISGIRFQLSLSDADLILEMEKEGSNGSPLVVGDDVITEFRLDDTKRTTIKHKAIVRWISDRYVGIQFTGKKTHPALKLYMWN